MSEAVFRRVSDLVRDDPSEFALSRILLEGGLLPTYPKNGELWVLAGDLEALTPLIYVLRNQEAEISHEHPLLGTGAVSGIPVSTLTRLDFTSMPPRMDPAFCAALRRLADVPSADDRGAPRTIPYLGQALLTTRSIATASLANCQVARTRELADTKSNVFANSAYYMGSKRALTGMIMEAADRHACSNTLFVDLMCGSGVVAAAAAKYWECLASDAQLFCRMLAVVQGAGFSRSRAEILLGRLMPRARKHAEDLASRVRGLLDLEDDVLHSDANDGLLERYRHFTQVLPTHPTSGEFDGWAPSEEVRLRQNRQQTYPYVLFTAYFAGIYFGLRQCIEIDSLRFAIDAVTGEGEREWALGALVAALSGVGTTYGGHFAQPPIRNEQKLSPRKLARLLESRARSLFHEFAVRLENLAAESEKAVRPVASIAGPWPGAVESIKSLYPHRDVLVYVDAPYRREEYSRYYHVLETCVRYQYPSAIGRGRVPSKSAGDRFASPLATRKVAGVQGELASIICSVLEAGWTCMWSYSDAADASAAAVIEQVAAHVQCSVESFAAPYHYKGQGGHDPRRVTELVVVFSEKT